MVRRDRKRLGGRPYVLVVGVALDQVVGIIVDYEAAEDERGEGAVDGERDPPERQKQLHAEPNPN